LFICGFKGRGKHPAISSGSTSRTWKKQRYWIEKSAEETKKVPTEKKIEGADLDGECHSDGLSQALGPP